MTRSQNTTPRCYNASITTCLTSNMDKSKDSSRQAPSEYAFSAQRGISQYRSQCVEHPSACSVTIEVESVDLTSFDLLFAVLRYSMATYSSTSPHVVRSFSKRFISPRRVPSFGSFVHINSSSTYLSLHHALFNSSTGTSCHASCCFPRRRCTV